MPNECSSTEKQRPTSNPLTMLFKLLQVNRPLTMKKENIQKRKRKPKSSAVNESQALTQSPVVSVQQQHLHLALQPHATTQTHHHQLNSSHTHHAHIHQHVHHNSHSASQHSNQGQLHVHHSAAGQQHMLANAITANQLQQASSNGNALIHQSVSNGSSSHHHPSHNLSQVSTPKDLIQNLNQASNASNSTNGNCTSAHLNRALHLNRLDDLTMAMAAGSANGVLSNLSNSNSGSAAQALNANNLIIVDSASLHPLTKFSDVLYHQNNGAMIANLGAGGHHLEHSLSSSSGGANELSSDHSPNSPNTPSSSMLTRQIIPVDQFFYSNANVKVEAKNC